MVTAEKPSRSQRRRWEEGRRRLARAVAPGLLLEALRTRSLLLLDLAADLLIPPLSAVCLVVLAGTAVSTGAFVLGRVGWSPVAAWGACGLMLATYVARGVVLSGAGLRGFADLAAAPVYVAWKLALRLRGFRGDGRWVRTMREGEEKP
jgi:1,2-diacylglycerol 3-beta-glucosyltransferase